MARTATARRTTAALAALSLGILALTACNEGTDKDSSAPGATASPSAIGDTDDASPRPSTGAPSEAASPDSGAGTATPTADGAGDDQDGGVGMCETTDLAYNVTVASKPVNHALLTASNNGGDPCLLPANDLVITIPTLDGAAEHMGPTGEDWLLNPGEKAYAGILFSRADTPGGKSATQVEIALTAAESPSTVTVNGGPVTVNDTAVTSFFGTAEDALTY
ncbi:DUF4232 domain-containing protein [Streptomyces sp. NPDC003832]